MVVNLASVEYSAVALCPSQRARVVDRRLEERREGGCKVISFSAKRARGLMARYAVEHHVRRPEHLEGFASAGYTLARDASTPDRLVFCRFA